MTVEDSAVAVEDIDVAIAVVVPEIGSGGALDDQRIDQLLGLRVEAGDHTAIGEDAAVVLGKFLGACGARGVALDQILEVGLLHGIQAAGLAALQRA